MRKLYGEARARGRERAAKGRSGEQSVLMARLDGLLGELERHGTCELGRTGLIAIGRGSSTITDDQPQLAVCA